MTLVVALGCTDGVILAADSASSDAESGIKQPVHKVKRLGDLPVLYGGSGDVGLKQNLDEALAGFSLKPTLKRTRQELKKLIVQELAAARQLHVPFPQQGFNAQPIGILLFAGISDGKSWILEFERDGRDTLYGEEYGNFYAIGSGKPWAQALIRPHLGTERDVRLGKVFVHRVLEDAIDLAVGGVSKPIHIHCIDLDGNVSEVSPDEMTELEQTCELWREFERDAVGKLLAPEVGADDIVTIPAPEPMEEPPAEPPP